MWVGREFQNDSQLATPEGAVLGGVGPYRTISESLSFSQLRPQHALLGWFRAAFPGGEEKGSGVFVDRFVRLGRTPPSPARRW